MRTFAEHQGAVRELLEPVKTELAAPAGHEELPIAHAFAAESALGRVLARRRALPRRPARLRELADGRLRGALRRPRDGDGTGAPVSLAVGMTTAAGDPVRRHLPGTASPVMTGAPVPDGADAVVPIELADPPRFLGIDGGGREAPAGASVAFAQPAEPGAFVREVGTDVARGEVLLPAGIRLGPAQLGALSAAGVTRVVVRRPLSVLLLSTGQELPTARGDRSPRARSTTPTRPCSAPPSARAARSCRTRSRPTTRVR